MGSLSPDLRLMPKRESASRASFGGDGSDKEEPGSARSRKRMTAIACYQCRKRKCKCDGKQPCANCVRRNTACEFDTVSGSVHTEDLKDRIRGLETALRASQERNTFLEDVLQRHGLTNAMRGGLGILPEQPPATGDPEVWGTSAVGGPSSSMTPGYSTELSTEISLSPSDGQPPQYYATNMKPRTAATNMQQRHPQTHPSFIPTGYQAKLHAYTTPQALIRRTSSPGSSAAHNRFSNGALEIFLTQHRVALERGEDPNIILNSGLDVGPLIDPARPMTEWSSWALQLPLSVPDMSFSSKLACAYVTYHQLRWLIYPTQENYNMIPDFVKPMVAQLCIPQTIWVHLMIRDALHSSKVLVTDVNSGANAVPNLLSSTLKEWDRPMSDATMFHVRSGHTRLTPEFEKYIKHSSNWFAVGSAPVVAVVDSSAITPGAFSNYYQASAPYG